MRDKLTQQTRLERSSKGHLETNLIRYFPRVHARKLVPRTIKATRRAGLAANKASWWRGTKRVERVGCGFVRVSSMRIDRNLERGLKMKVRNAVSMAWGMAIGCLTFAAGPIGWASANPIIAAVQWVLLILILPGIIGGGAVSGSMHTVFLGVGAVINALLHFGLCWALFPLFSRSQEKGDARDAGSGV